jgi:hypothetical protein
MSGDDLTERLDRALDAVLAIRVALVGGGWCSLPDDALDTALSKDKCFQEARREFVAALEALQRAGVDASAVLDIEAAAHSMVSRAAEVAWRLGLAVQGRVGGLTD